MTDEDLDAIRQRAEAQSPGPWDGVIALVDEYRQLRVLVEQLQRKRGFAPIYITEPQDP